jgi:hypothetical protein
VVSEEWLQCHEQVSYDDDYLAILVSYLRHFYHRGYPYGVLVFLRSVSKHNLVNHIFNTSLLSFKTAYRPKLGRRARQILFRLLCRQPRLNFIVPSSIQECVSCGFICIPLYYRLIYRLIAQLRSERIKRMF